VPVRVEEQTVLDAIGSLARNARLNYQLDPRIIQGLDAENKPSPILTNSLSVRWDNVRPRAALEAFLANYNMILMEQTNTGVYRVTYKPPVPPEPPVTRAYALKHAVATNLVAVISNTIPTAKVFADQRTSQILVTAVEKDQTTVSNLLLRLDNSVRQILIAAQFWETAKNPTSVKGIDWSQTLEKQNFQFGNGLTTVGSTTDRPGQGGTVTLPSGRQVESSSGSSTSSREQTSVSSVSPLPSLPTSVPGISANTLSGFSPATAFLSADGVRATLSFLNKDSDTESIATPRAVTLDGQPADLSVVRNIPVFEEQQGSQNQGVVQPNTVKPNYDLKVGQDTLNAVGVRLIVTPHVVGDTNILLDLKPEISTVEAEPAKATLGGRANEAPIFARRRVSTQAIVPDGTTLVLGGLNSSEKNISYTKVPILGDLPVIGLAFRKDGKSRNKRNLLLFVTPTIIRDSDFQPETKDAEFMRKSRAMDVEEKDSAWDSGRPYDWKSGLEPVNK
jgi:type II secretory pathway component GspD/PulD (secretin)